MRRKVIEIRELEYVYPDGTRALKGIDLDIFEAETLAIIGPNGAGKSTLLLHLNGILLANRGSVSVLGREIRKKDLNHVRREVGLVFQDPDDQLFSTTVFDDIAFGPLNLGLDEVEVRRRVRGALQKVGLDGYEERCPHHLSIGEKKRIAMATVLSMEPAILVLDEPTSNLDPGARRGFIELFKNLDQTKIIATHDLDLVAETCERTVLLFNGRMVKEGTTREILTDIKLLEAHSLEPPLLTRLFHRQGIRPLPLTLEDALSLGQG